MVMTVPPRNQLAVIYDGNCGICTRAVRMLERWDRRNHFEIIPYQDPSVPHRFGWITPEQFREAMQLVDHNQQTWAGAAAIERILDDLPAGWLFGWFWRLPLANRLYRWFARHRYRFGCGDHCSIAGPGRSVS
jgi:predicted DCC family thiol-disulfide oxidoreductase YuxK